MDYGGLIECPLINLSIPWCAVGFRGVFIWYSVIPRGVRPSHGSTLHRCRNASFVIWNDREYLTVKNEAGFLHFVSYGRMSPNFSTLFHMKAFFFISYGIMKPNFSTLFHSEALFLVWFGSFFSISFERFSCFIRKQGVQSHSSLSLRSVIWNYFVVISWGLEKIWLLHFAEKKLFHQA